MRAQIKLTSVLVDDQAKVLAFCTEKLGFVKERDKARGRVPVAESGEMTGHAKVNLRQ